MKHLFLFVFALLVCSVIEAQSAQDYTWRNVPIGSGGYITGMRIHPMSPHHKYFRTDVGGAYRRDEGLGRLKQLFKFGSDCVNYYSVAGITFNPNNPNSVIMAVDRSCSATKSAILVSDDAGENWTEINVPFYFAANGGRNCTGNDSDKDREGNCIEVNPLNTNEVYIGTRDKGLWVLDLTDPTNPLQVPDTSIPHNTERLSIRSVMFHPTEQDKIFIAYSGHGVYMGDTDDGTWQKIDGNDPNLANVQDLSFSVSGNSLYAACIGDGIYKCANPTLNSRIWTQKLSYAGNDRGYLTVSASPHDEQTVVTVQNNWDSFDNIRVSIDGGDTWSSPDGTMANIYPWKTTGFMSNCSQLVFDPESPNKLYSSAFFGSYETHDFTADPIAWTNEMNRGHEEVVNTQITTFPTNTAGNHLLLMDGDHTGFLYGDISEDAYPLSEIRAAIDDPEDVIKGGTATYCESDPDHLAVCLPFEWNNTEAGLAFSADGGLTFQRSATYNESWQKSVIALSSLDPDRVVVANKFGIWWEDRSTQNGFAQAAASPSVNGNCEQFSFTCLGPSDILTDSLINPSVFSVYRPLASDKSMACVFYFYNQFDGSFHVSTDNGESWCKVNDQLPQINSVWNNKIHLSSIPAQPGHLYLNFSNQLLKSTDGGQSWSSVSNVQDALCFGIGKEKAGEAYPALYIFGKANGDTQQRPYLSWDAGVSWVQITDITENNWGNPANIAGDANVYGRVYLGVGGQGVFVGEYQDEPFIDIVSPALGESYALGEEIHIEWNSNILANTGMTVWQGPDYVDYLGQLDIQEGEFFWTVPNNFVTGDYEIRLKSLDANETTSYSGTFSIIQNCPEDINADGTIDINDFLALNSAFGSTCQDCPEDINNDGEVDINDFLSLNSAFGDTCP